MRLRAGATTFGRCQCPENRRVSAANLFVLQQDEVLRRGTVTTRLTTE